MDIKFGNIIKTRDLVFSEGGVKYLTILETHFLAQGRAETHDDCALDLFAQIVGIDDGPALERLANVAHLEFILSRIYLDLGAGGWGWGG